MKKIIQIFLLLILITSCSGNNSKTDNTQNIKSNSFEILAKIPESSGICYYNKTETFFIVHDEGKIYEIDKTGKILREKKIGKYDLEGIICNQELGTVYALIENTGNILDISINNLEIIKEISLDISKKDRKKYFNSKSGAEGLAINGNIIYISTQADKNNLLEFKFSENNTKLQLVKVYDVDSQDLSGMIFFNNILHIVSDKNDKIYQYDLEKSKISETKKLEKGNWEGIVFDNLGELYLVDDSGNIVKYNQK